MCCGIFQPQVRVDALRRLQGLGRAGLHQGIPGGDREDRDQGEDGPEVRLVHASKCLYKFTVCTNSKFEFQTGDRGAEAREVQASTWSFPGEHHVRNILTLKKYIIILQNILGICRLDFDQFRDVLSGNLPLLTKIFRNELVIPEFETFCQNVTRLYDKFKDNFDGEVF